MKESERQTERRTYLDNFFPKIEPRAPFEPRLLRKSSVYQPTPIEPPEPKRVRTPQREGGKSKNQAGGKEGSITFKDCDGATLLDFRWNKHGIQTEGDHEIEAGCDDGGSSPG